VWQNKSSTCRVVPQPAAAPRQAHCNSLQHTATRRNTLQHTATRCNTLQHITTCCSTLQHTAPCCNTLDTAIYYSSLPHTETHLRCSILQVAATHKQFLFGGYTELQFNTPTRKPTPYIPYITAPYLSKEPYVPQKRPICISRRCHFRYTCHKYIPQNGHIPRKRALYLPQKSSISLLPPAKEPHPEMHVLSQWTGCMPKIIRSVSCKVRKSHSQTFTMRRDRAYRART